MGVSSNSQRHKAAYDPQRKWGLSPAEGGNIASSSEVDGATYLVAGHVVAAGKRDLFVNETVGREAQARAARKANSRDTDAALKRLFARDREGMKAVQEARKFAKNVLGKQNAEAKALRKDGSFSRRKKKKRERDDVSDGDSESESEIDGGCASASESEGVSGDKLTKNAYSARVIKELGFDPTALKSSHDGRRKNDESQYIYSKLAELASCREADKMSLGPRPGGRVKSVVSAPKEQRRLLGGLGPSDGIVDLDESSSSDDDPVTEPTRTL